MVSVFIYFRVIGLLVLLNCVVKISAQCQPNNLVTTQVSSTQLSLSWKCYDPNGDDQLQVTYQLINGGQCDTGDGSQDPLFDIQTTVWGTANRQFTTNTNVYDHSATLTNLLPYSTYGVSVRSRQPNGAGGYNSPETPTYLNPNPTTSEAAPGTFGSESISYTPYADQLYFSWTIPCGSRNGLITSYQYILRDVNNNLITGATATEATSVVITGLSCDTTYRFHVAGINSKGTGQYSEYKTANTNCCARGPGPVGNLRTTSVSATEIRLYWVAPTDRGCPAQINLQYVVTYTGESLQSRCTLLSQGSASIQDLDYTMSSLASYYEYTISVYAVGGEANRRTITSRTPQSVPGAVRNIQIIGSSSTSLSVSWDAPINVCPPDSYTVATQITNRDQCFTITDGPIIPAGSPTGLSYQVTGLIPYSTYTLYVTPVNTAGYGITSEVSGTTAQTVPIVMPTNVVALIDIGPNFITFGWDSIPCRSRGGQITYRYELWLNDGSDMVDRDGTTSDSVTQVTFNDLMCSIGYVFRVRAVTEAGEGPWSQDYITATSLTVRRITFTNTLATELHTTWTVDNRGCGSPQYLVEYILVNKDQCETIVGGTRITGGTTTETSFILTGLLPHSTYQVFVTPMVDGGTVTGMSEQMTTAQAGPSEGPAVTVTESTANSLAFSWTEVPCGSRGGPITGYTYQLVIKDDNTIVTDQDTADATQMSVNISSGLQLGQTYEFQIAAINVIGTGPSTTIITSTIAGPDPPESVLLSESDSTSTSLTFSWNAVSCDNMDTCNFIGGYSYRVFNLIDGLISNGETIAIETSVVIPNLEPCTTYRFGVAATSELGVVGSYSDYVEGRTAVEAPSVVPDITSFETLNPSTHEIRWDAPFGPCPTDFYSVKYILRNRDMCEEVNGNSAIDLGSVTNTNVQINDLEPFSQYTIFVTPHNVAGRGPEQQADGTTGEQIPSAPPSTIRNTDVTTNTASFVWDEVPCGSRHGIIQTYQCQLINTADSEEIFTKTISTTDVTFDGLQPCAEYSFTVKALNGPMTDGIRITTKSVAPFPVLSIGALPPLPSTDLPRDPTVQWTPSSESLCPATAYLVQYKLTLKDQCMATPNDAIQTHATVMGTSTTLTGLIPHSTYTVSVTARNDAGDAAPVDGTDIQTGEEAPSGPPATVMVTEVGKRSLSVTWMQPVCGERNGEITMYSYVLSDLYRDTSKSSTISDTSVVFTDLTPYVRYAFKVSAWTSVGEGPFIDTVVNQTLEDRPSQPLNLVSSNANATSITIQWSPPDPPHGVIVGYEVQYWEGSGSTMTALTTRNEYTLSGLQVNDMVSFQVRAETGPGKGIWSNTVKAIAVEGVPGIPVNLTALDIEETSVRLQWKSPMNSNGLIIDYPIKYKAIQKTYDSSFVPSDKAYVSPSAMLNLDGSIHGYTVDNLSPSTKYEFLVAGRTSAGSGEYARIEVFTKAFTGLKRPDSPAVKIAKGVGIISFNDLPEFVSNVYITIENGNGRRRRQQGGSNPLHAFIVANLTRKEVDETMTFTVGDNKTYGEYVNHALIGGQSYGSKVAYATCTPEECLEEWSSLSIFTAPSGTFNQSGTINLLGPVVGGVVAVILVAVVLFALICYYRRNKASTKEKPKETAKDENEIYDEIDPKKEMMAKQQQQQQRLQTLETGYEVNMAMETKMSPRAQSDGSAYEDVNIKEEAEYQGLNLDAVDEEQTYQDLKGNASGDKSAPQYANV